MLSFFFFLWILVYGINNAGVALEMLKANPNLATVKNGDEETVLHVLACNPSAFVSGSRPGLLRRHLNILCEFIPTLKFLNPSWWYTTQ